MSDEVINCRAGNHWFPMLDPDTQFRDYRQDGRMVTEVIRFCKAGCGSTRTAVMDAQSMEYIVAPKYDYTDPGYTSTRGTGSRVPKDAARVEAALRMRARRHLADAAA
jgi:hypothetical protein